jgi:transcription elongation GreA/GreB family factor
MQRRNDVNSRHLRIREISRKITELTDELNALLLIDSTNNRSNPGQDIRIGDTVVITNHYKGLQGASGTVISISPKQVTVQLRDRRIIRRNKSNVTKIQDHE